MATETITLSMPAELVRRAKMLAAQRDMSVSSLVAGCSSSSSAARCATTTRRQPANAS